MSSFVRSYSRSRKHFIAHSFRRRLLAVLAGGCLAAALLLASAAQAQVSAAISGRVTDPAGATVSSADVTVTNLETGETRKTVTDDGGRYSVPSLALGEYEVHVAKQGFREEVRGGIHLVVGQEAAVDFALTLGQLTD